MKLPTKSSLVTDKVNRMVGLCAGLLAGAHSLAHAQPVVQLAPPTAERAPVSAASGLANNPEPTREVAAWDGESVPDAAPPRTDTSIRAAFADYSFVASQRPLAEPASWARVSNRFLVLLERKAYPTAHERLVFAVYAAYAARIAGQLSTRDARMLHDHALAAVKDISRLTYQHEVDIIVEAVVLGGLKPDPALLRLASERTRLFCQ